MSALPMLVRDADGSVDHAVMVARMLRRDWEPAPSGSEEDLLSDALAQWVLRVAPIVQAAIRQRAAGLAMLDDGDGDREWVDACSATEAAVSRAFGEIEVAA